MDDVKPLKFVGSSRRDLKAMLDEVRRSFGTALYLAQSGDKADKAKPLKGFCGAGVLELIATRLKKAEEMYAARNDNEPKMTTEKVKAEKIEVMPSCGNVFADLDLPDPELLLAKAKLSIKVERLIKERRLTQNQAAKLMGLTQLDLSKLLNGRLDDFTLDHLFRCLDALGQEIQIIVRPKPSSQIAM